MASFFRRLRREKEEPTQTPDEGEVVEDVPEDPQTVQEAKESAAVDGGPPRREPPAPGDPLGPSPDAGAFPEGAPSPPGRSSPTAEIDTGPPPPLPAADAQLDRTPGARRDGVPRHCFICGTEMDGPWCPACRMVWNE